MNEYEMMTVFHPRMNADETSEAVTALEEQIAANGGELLGTDDWGRRRLAYPIDGVVDGTFVLLTFKMPATGTAALERWIRLSETTLRHLLIRGIIPFEGDRDGGRDDRDDRGREERRDDEPSEPAPEAAPASSTTPAEAADTSAGETPTDGAGEAGESTEAPAAEAAPQEPEDAEAGSTEAEAETED